LEEFYVYYPLLFATARSLLGSSAEIEDIVQESYIRYATAAAQQIGSLRAYLTTIVTRLCLDYLRSARARREQPCGLWATEVSARDAASAAETCEELVLSALEQEEALTRALYILQERLTPRECAVFLLHEAFACPYEEIARLLNRSTATCRQILHRARLHLTAVEGRFAVSPQMHSRLVRSFRAAAQHGQLQTLLELLLREPEQEEEQTRTLCCSTSEEHYG
jgi:RNA polymerase sigma-70 factor (ECF subfamily)